MIKIILDRSGDLRRNVFYRFGVPFDDGTDGLPRNPEWVVAPRTPTYEQLFAAGTKDRDNWMWMSGLGNLEDRMETRGCPVNSSHVTRFLYKTFQAEAFGGNRVSPFIATSIGDAFALSDELSRRINALKVRGARIDPIDLKGHVSGKKLAGFWALQFVGEGQLRKPFLEGAFNRCPYCERGKIFCESCGDWTGWCRYCNAPGLAIREDLHEGDADKRIPFEPNLWNLIEGKLWDGSDLVQAGGRNFASKRFIDWLLRIHAAPFYAEPVYFCVDGMSDQQKQWFDDLQRPFEV